MLTRTLLRAIFLSMLVAPIGAHALGLGPIQVRSALNQTFDAEIPLIVNNPAELVGITARIPPQKEFDQVGIERLELFSKLRFVIQPTPNGQGFIKITSTQPIRDPNFDLLLETVWSRGRLLRTFPIQLDPELYAQRQPAPPLAESPSAALVMESPTKVAAATPASSNLPAAPEVSFEGASSYGPVRRGENLTQIARQVRPSEAISVPQMMAILVAGNPQAFSRGNPNTLRLGAVLKVPSAQALGVSETTSPATASATTAPTESGLTPPSESGLAPPTPVEPPAPAEPTPAVADAAPTAIPATPSAPTTPEPSAASPEAQTATPSAAPATAPAVTPPVSTPTESTAAPAPIPSTAPEPAPLASPEVASTTQAPTAPATTQPTLPAPQEIVPQALTPPTSETPAAETTETTPATSAAPSAEAPPAAATTTEEKAQAVEPPAAAASTPPTVPATVPEEESASWLADPVLWSAVGLIVLAVAALLLLPLVRRNLQARAATPARAAHSETPDTAAETPVPAALDATVDQSRSRIPTPREPRSRRPLAAAALGGTSTIDAEAVSSTVVKPRPGRAATPPKPIDELLKNIDFNLGGEPAAAAPPIKPHSSAAQRMLDTEPPTASVSRSSELLDGAPLAKAKPAQPIPAASLRTPAAPVDPMPIPAAAVPSGLQFDKLEFDLSDLGLDASRKSVELPDLELTPKSATPAAPASQPSSAPAAAGTGLDSDFGTLDFNLDLALPSVRLTPDEAPQAKDDPPKPNLTDLKFEFSTVNPAPENTAELAALDKELQSFGGELDLGKMTLDDPSKDSPEVGAGYIETKLDLAAAYVDMGDAAGARGLLEDVLREGDAAQKKQAEALLKKMG